MNLNGGENGGKKYAGRCVGFKKIICENYYFVDKTRFIQELIDQRREVTLIARPRRFEKTLNLSMLQYFFTLDNAKENRKFLKGNEYLDFAVVTGITRISKESIFSGLNNIRVCSVLSDLYADIFGFTADEAEKLMRDSGVAAKMSELKQ